VANDDIEQQVNAEAWVEEWRNESKRTPLKYWQIVC
jgi:hypothetical protein